MVLAIITCEMWELVQEFLKAKANKNVCVGKNNPCHKYSGLLNYSECGCSFVEKVRKTKGNPDSVEYVCNVYHRYSEANCTSHRIQEEILDRIVQAELEVIRLVFDDLWENVETDVKKWATGKSTTEKRLENLEERISSTEIEIQKNLVEGIEDKQNSDINGGEYNDCYEDYIEEIAIENVKKRHGRL